MKILRVNMRSKEIKYYDDDSLTYGRHFIAKTLSNEVDPLCDPLGPDNKIIISVGCLSGTYISCVNRISVGAKSPLTGGAKESNGGGIAALRLGENNIGAIIIEEKPDIVTSWVLEINADNYVLIKMEELLGMGVYSSAEFLYKRFGDRIGMILIGPSGEKLLPAAGVACNDKDGTPSRYCARGGIGAVMGSKCLKAIVIHPGSRRKPIHRENFKIEAQQYHDLLKKHPATSEALTKRSTVNIMDFTNYLGALPVRNFSLGSYTGVDQINSEALINKICERNGDGNISHACMPGCLIRCSNVYPDLKGKLLVSPLEYESIALLGSNLCIDDLDAIAEMNRLCNDFGVDTIEIGAALGVCMEAGIIPFGDKNKAVELVEEVGNLSILGRLLGCGAKITGTVLGVDRVPEVKGQAMPAYDPRAAKGLGVTYATSAMGADHTAGNTIRYEINHYEQDKQVKASQMAQVLAAIFDSLGMCVFVASAVKNEMSIIANMLGFFRGKAVHKNDLYELAVETLNYERSFNIKAGLCFGQDVLPSFFYEEINPVSKTVFDISSDMLEDVYKLPEENIFI